MLGGESGQCIGHIERTMVSPLAEIVCLTCLDNWLLSGRLHAHLPQGSGLLVARYNQHYVQSDQKYPSLIRTFEARVH
jgi:hypothetical protein